MQYAGGHIGRNGKRAHDRRAAKLQGPVGASEAAGPPARDTVLS